MEKQNKKGASIGGWVEAGLFSILFVLVLAIVIANLNIIYDKNVDGTFGISDNGSLQQFQAYQESLKTATETGEASTSTFTGISLSSTWDMIKLGMSTAWYFVSGGWISKAVAMVQLPDIVALILKALYVISIGLIAIKLIMKVKP